MSKALWVIAICEVVRAIQNIVPVVMSIYESRDRKRALDALIASFDRTDEAQEAAYNKMLEMMGK